MMAYSPPVYLHVASNVQMGDSAYDAHEAADRDVQTGAFT